MNKYNIDATDDDLETLEKNIEDSLVKKVIDSLAAKVTSDGTTINFNVPDIGIIGQITINNPNIRKGYVCLGYSYNNMIIQFGESSTYMTGSTNLADVYFPISFNNNYVLIASHLGTGGANVIEVYTYHNLTNTKLMITSSLNTFMAGWIGSWIAVGW